MRAVFSLFLLFFLPIAAAEFNPRTIGFLEADVEISSSLALSGMVEELNYSMYGPQVYEDLQTSSPVHKMRDAYGNEKLVFRWKDFAGGSFSLKAKIKNPAVFSEAKALPFPYAAPKELWPYLAESDNIIITDGIRDKARELTQGSRNAFEALARLSHWAFTNIDYQIAYGNAIYDSAWVFDNRKGTCDEFSNVLIAMLRSVGIPARYSAGIIYSKGGWGYHAWAEAYLDRWVPVDPTWDEIGWLDASHIPTGSFVDGKEVLVEARYLAPREVDLDINTIPKPEVKVLGTKELPEVFSVAHTSFPKVIGRGMSSVIEAGIENRGKGCLATSSEITSRVDDGGKKIVSFEGDEEKLIALCPGEMEKVHFIMEARDDLEEGYVFSKLVDIKTFLGVPIVPDVEIDTTLKKKGGVFLSLARDGAAKGETVDFEASEGSRVFSSLPISGISVVAERTGNHYVIAADGNGNVIKKELEVTEKLPFSVTGLSYPREVKCGETFNVSFSIEGEKNVSVRGEGSADIAIGGLEAEPPANVFLEARVAEQCSGEPQFLALDIGGQRYYLRVSEKRRFGSGGVSSIMALFRSLLDRLLSLLGIFGQN